MWLHYFAATCTVANASNFVCKTSLPNTAASSSNLSTILLIVFTVIGALAFLFVVLAGTRYIFAQGNPESIQKAKNELRYSLIGLVLAALSAAIVNFVIGGL